MLRRAIERGLLAADFENMTLGMVIDFLTTCQNEDHEAKQEQKRGRTRIATADDIAAF